MQISSPWSAVEVRHTVDAPRDDVFNLLADPTTYPEWLVGAQRIRSVDPDFPAPGAAFEHSFGPSKTATIEDTTKAVEAHGHRQLVLEVHVGPFEAEVVFSLRKRADDVTEIVMQERPTGHFAPFTPLLRPVLAVRNKESLRAFGRFVERKNREAAAA